jgi:hypothetical protein
MRYAAAALLSALLLAACSEGYGPKTAAPPVPVPDDKEADWRLYGQTPEFDTKVDLASLETVDHGGYAEELVMVWVLREFKTDQKSKFEDEDDYRREYARFAIDCAKRELAGIAVERHDKEGYETSRRDVPGFQWEFKPATPGTYEADFVGQVCKLAKEKAAAEKK